MIINSINITRNKRIKKKDQTKDPMNIDDKVIPNSPSNPQDKNTIEYKQSLAAIGMIRSSENFVKAVTESLSSGFCSNNDMIEHDADYFKIFNDITRSNKSEAVVQNECKTEVKPDTPISPSTVIKKFNCRSNEEQTDELLVSNESTGCNWLSDQQSFPQSNDLLQNFNFDENLFNVNELFTTNSAPYEMKSNDPIQQFLNFSNPNFFDQQITENQPLVDNNLQIWNQPIEQFMNTINNQNSSNILDLNMISTQRFLQDQGIKNEQVNEQIINGFENCSIDQKNLTTIFQDCSNYVQGINIQNVNNVVQGQNVILRVLPNSQIQLTPMEQANFQQTLMNNINQNLANASFSLQDLNSRQFQNQNFINNSAIYFNVDGRKPVNSYKKSEPIDLMENPANWRRVPNNGGYQCNLCNKSYTRKYGLKIHLRIHSGFKPLECKVCQKKFGDPSNMAKHIRLHSSDGSPYKCTLCDKPLVRRRDLERHMRSRHPEMPQKPQNMERKRNL